jgi:hypothetical protein
MPNTIGLDSEIGDRFRQEVALTAGHSPDDAEGFDSSSDKIGQGSIR